MKKKLVWLMIGAMGIMLVACGQQNGEAEVSAPVIEDIPVEASESESTESIESTENVDSEDEIYVEMGTGFANPWVDSDRMGVLGATGFDLVAPADAVNVAYSYMSIDGMAQMNFNIENAMWVYRMQPTDELLDISGIYCEWDYIGETKVAGMDAMEYSYASEVEGDFLDGMDCTRVVNWYDPEAKVTHSLSVIGKDLNGMDTVTYAENLFYAE